MFENGLGGLGVAVLCTWVRSPFHGKVDIKTQKGRKGVLAVKKEEEEREGLASARLVSGISRIREVYHWVYFYGIVLHFLFKRVTRPSEINSVSRASLGKSYLWLQFEFCSFFP